MWQGRKDAALRGGIDFFFPRLVPFFVIILISLMIPPPRFYLFL